MANKTVNIITIICLLVSANSKADGAEKDYALQIYLPREVTINGDIPNLGQVGIIRGQESLAVKAGEIALGRISLPGQEIVVDRQTVLSRLACNGIAVSEVMLTGAEKVLVKRQHQVIEGGSFVETALSFVKKNPPNDSVCGFSPVRIPEDLVVPGPSQNINLHPRFVRSGAQNQVKTLIAAFSSGKEVGAREVIFRLKYNCRRLVTQMNIPAGAIISPENVKVENTISNYPEPADWMGFAFRNTSQTEGPILPYGLVAKRRLPANTVIRSGMIGPAQPLILLKRNQNVVIKIDRSGLVVTTSGRVIQQGGVGEYIKVRNVDSQRIILAKVNEDGTVEPVF